MVSGRPLENIALDIIDMQVEEYILVGIDYFTRFVAMKVLDSKATKGVVEMVETWAKEGKVIEETVAYNRKRFSSEGFMLFCKMYGIRHRKVDAESHKAMEEWRKSLEYSEKS